MAGANSKFKTMSGGGGTFFDARALNLLEQRARGTGSADCATEACLTEINVYCSARLILAMIWEKKQCDANTRLFFDLGCILLINDAVWMWLSRNGTQKQAPPR